MVSTLNVAAIALGALLFWTCLGATVARRLVPAALVLPLAPTLGWAVHSVLALPIFELAGFSQATVLGLALLVLAAGYAWRRRGMSPVPADDAARVPVWAYGAAALLALAPAAAILPKTVADGVILAGPAFDHSKIAIIDEMVRLGVPPGNPFIGSELGAGRLVYYYLLHFSAAELALAFRVSGWAADVAMTYVAAFASLAAMMGLAVRLCARASAAYWVVPLSLSGSLRPLLSLVWSPDRLGAVLRPANGFGGWIFQSAWVPQHLMAAACVIAAAVLMCGLARKGVLRVIVTALVVAAAFESSTWIGGIVFALAAPAIGAALMWGAEPGERRLLAARFAAAGVLTLVVAAPFLHDQLGAHMSRGGGPPVVLSAYHVLGDFLPQVPRRVLDVPAFWLILLVVELPAIWLAGMAALPALLAGSTLDGDQRRETLALTLLTIAGLMVSWLLVSTIGDNNDLGWRAVLPPVVGLTALAAAGLAQWVAARAWLAVAACLVAVALGLPRGLEIIREDLAGHMQADAAAFAQAPQMWAAVRRHAAPDERVANNPRYLEEVTPWPANISWALLANRRSCYAGREFASVFTMLDKAERDAIDALFARVFAGEGTADDVRELATRFGCRAVAVTAADGAWTRDPFAASPFYRLLESRPDRWRVYRALAPGDGGYRP